MKNTVIWITIIIASVVALHTNWDNIAPQVLSAHSVMADMLNRANGDDRAIPVVQAFNHMPTKQEVQPLVSGITLAKGHANLCY